MKASSWSPLMPPNHSAPSFLVIDFCTGGPFEAASEAGPLPAKVEPGPPLPPPLPLSPPSSMLLKSPMLKSPVPKSPVPKSPMPPSALPLSLIPAGGTTSLGPLPFFSLDNSLTIQVVGLVISSLLSWTAAKTFLTAFTSTPAAASATST
eukprot:CAMPEP_0171130240 /NCGR_PEP_ID=MMETSP0766_2-20121228/120537_1 /TAXON_ID=439317 /ORGANISM="Gambierdiscus australes, Strain CAWD 149" /LENGTH=149 /DNA_ID=CAMNT_0011593479 /DNA_START=12 /DNA_END=461 /DNA_ORIENTATION=-